MSGKEIIDKAIAESGGTWNANWQERNRYRHFLKTELRKVDQQQTQESDNINNKGEYAQSNWSWSLLFDRLRSLIKYDGSQNMKNSTTDKSNVGFSKLRKQIELIGIQVKDLNEQAEPGR
jgi:hypothetical protein